MTKKISHPFSISLSGVLTMFGQCLKACVSLIFGYISVYKYLFLRSSSEKTVLIGHSNQHTAYTFLQ